MRYWSRELAGWVLIGIGLYVFSQSYRLLTHEGYLVIQGCTLAVVGIVVFRGGIHLLKVAVAANVCLQPPAEAEPQRRTQSALPFPPAGTAFRGDFGSGRPASKATG